jgi:hypothetical protein
MAGIIGAMPMSHTPAMGLARDTRKQNAPAWKAIFEACEPVRGAATAGALHRVGDTGRNGVLIPFQPS